MIDAYCTVAEADADLASLVYVDWTVFTEAEKEEFLSWGRVYIDSKYTCLYDETDATDDIKNANALAGFLQSQGNLFSKTTEINSVSVTAGTVSSTKNYTLGKGIKDNDPLFVQIKALLIGDCTTSGGTSSVGLDRN